jgi:hypothetical protein
VDVGSFLYSVVNTMIKEKHSFPVPLLLLWIQRSIDDVEKTADRLRDPGLTTNMAKRGLRNAIWEEGRHTI